MHALSVPVTLPPPSSLNHQMHGITKLSTAPVCLHVNRMQSIIHTVNLQLFHRMMNRMTLLSAKGIVANVTDGRHMDACLSPNSAFHQQRLFKFNVGIDIFDFNWSAFSLFCSISLSLFLSHNSHFDDTNIGMSLKLFSHDEKKAIFRVIGFD